MATEFIDLGGYSYYLEPNSYDGKAPMIIGWKYIDGKWYYFYYDGSMAHDTWIDGYHVNSSGAWIVNTNINKKGLISICKFV